MKNVGAYNITIIENENKNREITDPSTHLA